MTLENVDGYVTSIKQAIWDTFHLYQSNSELDSRSMKSVEEVVQALVTILELSAEESSDNSIEIIGNCGYLMGASGLQSILAAALKNLPRGASTLKPGLYYAAAVAHEAASDKRSAKRMYVESWNNANARGQIPIAARAAIDVGRLAFQDDDIETARSWYEKAMLEANAHKDYLTKAKILTNLSATYLESDPMLAAKLAEQSLDLKKDSDATQDSILYSLGNLGIAKAKCGSHQEALAIFEEALDIAKDQKSPSEHARAILNVAIQKSILGDYEDAKSLFVKGLRLAKKANDRDTTILIQQAYAVRSFQQRQFRVAARMFSELSETCLEEGRQKDSAIALHDQAVSLARLGNASRSLEMINGALQQFEQLNDHDWERRCLLMKALELTKPRSDERLSILSKAIGIRGGHDKDLRITCSTQLWTELLDRGEFQKASRQLSRESKWLQKQPELLSRRLHEAAMELLDRNRLVESERLMQKAMSLLKQSDIAIPWFRQDYALILARRGVHGEAIRMMRQNLHMAKRKNDRLLEMHSIGNLGELERERGDARKAIPLLKEAIALGKKMHDLGEEAFWQNNLALALNDIDQTNKAIKLLQESLANAKAVNDVFQEARTLGTLGAMSAESHKFQQAVKQYDLAIAKARECEAQFFSAEMMYNKAAALYHQGEKDLALVEAEQAISTARECNDYDLAREIGITAAAWSIEWRRPVRAASFWATAFVCDLITETAVPEHTMAVLLIAKKELGPGQYKQFSQYVRREISKSAGEERTTELMDNIETLIEQELTKKLVETNQ